MTAAEMLASPTVALVDNRPATTSLDIAEHFGKRHDHVCRDIRRICAETPEKFHAPNFGEMSRTVKIGNGAEREETYFTVYFDGFILLVMGYTGKKALGMKLAYIEAFNAMREELEHRKEPVSNPDKLPSLSPSHRSELKGIVDAKLSTYPASVQGKARSEIWTRFNRHFRIAEYAQLPAERMAEARDYLIELEVKSLKALPTAPTAVPGVEEDLAFIRACAREIMERERRMYFTLREALPPLRGVTRPLALRLHESMDAGSVLLDAALKQVENTARLVIEYGRG